MSRPSVLVDCDPGHDDAIALIVASRLCDLVAITTVSGNASLADVTRNALIVTELFGLDVPVHAGCGRPLVQPAVHAPSVHGEDGLGGSTISSPTRERAPSHAVEAIIEITRAEEGLWLIPTAPLTNIALAIRMDPPIIDRVAGISLMGGGIRIGNVTPTAEFNIWCDPEAASIVFESGAPLRMCGLDVTHQVRVGPAEADGLARLGTPRATWLAGILRYFAERYHDRTGLVGGPMHDPLAVLAVTHPELFGLVERHVRIELAGGQRGTTVVDQRQLVSPEAANCLVAETVQAAEVLEIILETLELACTDIGPGGRGEGSS
ncbi:MAG TPA: nucleoside hydrolase [Acidimicrobiales bacterium]|nr:nucleoside hydrolase [Acidimicrobiales bacterium]